MAAPPSSGAPIRFTNSDMTLTNAVSDAPVPIREGQTRLYPRVLGDLGSGDAGRTLLCVAALHGNEPAGAQALEKVFSKHC